MYRKNTTFAPWASQGFALIHAQQGDELVVWNEQEINFTERALAIEALREVSHNRFPGLLTGVLYWKLSTNPKHFDIEPFVHILSDSRDSQMAKALRSLG